MGKQNPNSMIKIGDLKNVVTDLKTRNEELSSQYDQTNSDIEKGAARGQLGVGTMQIMRRREMQHNASKIDRYGGIIQKGTIMHDKARLAEKEAQYQKDYPLANTFTSKVVKKEPMINTMKMTTKIIKK